MCLLSRPGYALAWSLITPWIYQSGLCYMGIREGRGEDRDGAGPWCVSQVLVFRLSPRWQSYRQWDSGRQKDTSCLGAPSTEWEKKAFSPCLVLIQQGPHGMWQCISTLQAQRLKPSDVSFPLTQCTVRGRNTARSPKVFMVEMLRSWVGKEECERIIQELELKFEPPAPRLPEIRGWDSPLHAGGSWVGYTFLWAHYAQRLGNPGVAGRYYKENSL